MKSCLLPGLDPSDHRTFMPADGAGSGQLDLFREVAFGHLGIDSGAGESGHSLDILQPYNPVIHGYVPDTFLVAVVTVIFLSKPQ